MQHGLRPIGALTRQVTTSPLVSGSTEQARTTSPRSSETIGSQSQVVTLSKPTGTLPGATGSGSTSISTVQDLGPVMAGDDPKATDKVVEALLPPSVRSCLQPDYSTRFGPNGLESELMGYSLAGPISELDRHAALVALEVACAPAPLEETIILLGRLKVLTISPAQHGEDLQVQLKCYADELSRYPADIVRHVLRTHARQSKFWPTWSEIEERLSLHASRRQLMWCAVRNTGDGV